jgi:type 1 fimbria pilin
MKKIVGLTLGIAYLAAAFNAQASTSAELIVRGTIKPAACNLSMTGGGIINYGTIPSGQLLPTAFNPLAEMTTPLSISCGTTAAQFGLKFVDLQAASKVPGILNALGSGYTEAHNYGLGIASGRRTGGFAVTLRDLRSSTSVLNPIVRVSTGAWQNGDGKVAQSPSQHSWRSSTTVVPAMITQLTGTIAVRAVINRGQDLDLSRDITLDGRATLELNYI